MTKTYSSNVSFGLLIFIFLTCYVPFVPQLILEELDGRVLVTIGCISLVFSFILHLFFKTQYTIDHGELKIRCGFFSYQPIDIQTIKKISSTKNMMASLAPSFDRIEITYGKFDEVIISPKDKLSFVTDLIRINPRIKTNIIE